MVKSITYTTRVDPTENGNAAIVNYRYYGKGRNQYSSAGEEIQSEQKDKEFVDRLVNQGVLVRTSSLQEANDNNIRAFAGVLMLSPLKIVTIKVTSPVAELPNSGPIMKSLGAASKAEMIARKLNMNTTSLTTRQVLNSLEETVQSFISKFRKASIRAEIPGGFLTKMVREAITSSKTVRKLLIDNRFIK